MTHSDRSIKSGGFGFRVLHVHFVRSHDGGSRQRFVSIVAIYIENHPAGVSDARKLLFISRFGRVKSSGCVPRFAVCWLFVSIGCTLLMCGRVRRGDLWPGFSCLVLQVPARIVQRSMQASADVNNIRGTAARMFSFIDCKIRVESHKLGFARQF